MHPIQESPPQFEDTQPNPTQPLRPIQPQRWFWFAVIVFSSLSMLATLALGLQNNATIAITLTPVPLKDIVLMVNGQRTDYQTRAETIGAFLTEQNITLAPQDALSNTLDTLLQNEDIITIARAREVLLVIDGQQQTIRTPYSFPYDILRQQGITLSDNDTVWLDTMEVLPSEAVLWNLPVSSIAIARSLPITIVDGDTETQAFTTTRLIGDALFEAGITLYLADEVSPPVSEPISENLRINITRAQPLIIQADGTEIQTRVQGGNVGEALAEAGIALVGLDRTEPTLETEVTAGMNIQVIRVTEEIVTQEEPIAYETSYVADDNLPLDTLQTQQAGQNGTLSIQTRVRYEDGVEVGREEINRSVTLAPQNEVIAYGIQIVLYTITTPEGTFEYWRKLRVYATSYHPAALGGDNVTSIGETLRKGIVGADPTLIPYRTNIYVEGYGTGIIADTGGRRSSPYWIDLGYSDEDYQGWHWYVDIYLLTPVPPDIDYILPPWTPLRGTTGS
jgi:resuscitation-promoting factor RpfB